MEPTLSVGERVLVEKSAPQVGEIAVFYPPRDAEQEICGAARHVVQQGGAACSEPESQPAAVRFVKRIVAGPGDEVYVDGGHVFRKAAGTAKFIPEPDSFTKPCPAGNGECDFLTPITISAGHWFMMGDNRGESDDSRFYGPVPTSWIVGIVALNTPAASRE
jgi:signal peptidase I